MTNLSSKIAKCVVAGACFTLISAGSAFASEPATLEASITSHGTSAAYAGLAVEDHALAQKHQEIDQMIFDNGGHEQFAAAGFSVTHTGPMNGVIEIGIAPYDDTYAEMLYDLFGDSQVQVVEGVQAITFLAGPDAVGGGTDGEEPTFSTMVVGAPEPAEGEAVITSIDPVVDLDMPVSDAPTTLEPAPADGSEGEIVEDAQLISAPVDDEAVVEDAQLISAPVENSTQASNMWPWVAAIAAGLAAVGLIIRKVVASKK